MKCVQIWKRKEIKVNKMSKNRGTTTCKCGYELQLRNATTRPMTFREYMKAIGGDEDSYNCEFDTLIVCQVQCPRCGILYAMWIGGYCYSDITKQIIPYYLDTSYWYSFNDEPSKRDRLSIPI